MFNLSNVPNPSKEQLTKEMEGIPQHDVINARRRERYRMKKEMV